MADPRPTGPAQERRRRLWPKIVLGLVVLLAVLVAIAPFVAAAIAKPRIETELERSLAVDATLEELSIGWTGKVRAGRLSLKDLSGEPLLAIETLDLGIAPLAALAGRIDGGGRARGVELHLRRDAQGRWNVQDLPRAPRETPPGTPRPPGQPRELPEVAFDLALEASRIFVHDASAGTFTLGLLKGRLSVPALDRELELELDSPLVTPDGREGRIGLRGAVLVVREGRLDPSAPTGKLELEIERLPLDLAESLGFLPPSIEQLAGLLGGSLRVELDAPVAATQRARASGRFVATTFDLVLAPTGEGAPFALHQDEVGIDLALDGPLATGDLDAQLAGMEGTLDLRLSPLETAGIALEGDLSLALSGGRATLQGDLGLNGGKAELTGDLGLTARTEGPSTLALKVDGARARGELGPLLGHVHPVFAGLAKADSGLLTGVITSELSLALPTSALLDRIELGEEGFDPKELSGRGSFGLRGVKIEGAPLYDQLLALLGKEDQRDLTLEPVGFGIDAGRLTYDQPWTWTIAGTQTSFGGSIGLDGTLALAWAVPLDAGFVKEQGLPEELAGRTLTLPLSGTIDDPRLEWKGALDELARGAVQEELASRVDEVKRDLEEMLGDEIGTDVGDLLGDKGAEDPEALLSRADALWAQGKQDEARPLYKRLREEHKLTPTYLLNRDRIKERAKE